MKRMIVFIRYDPIRQTPQAYQPSAHHSPTFPLRPKANRAQAMFAHAPRVEKVPRHNVGRDLGWGG